MAKPFMGKIQNWGIVWHEPNQFFVVVGEGGPDNYVRTSAIVTLTANLVETRNSIYKLGKPDPEAAQAAFNIRKAYR